MPARIEDICHELREIERGAGLLAQVLEVTVTDRGPTGDTLFFIPGPWIIGGYCQPESPIPFTPDELQTMMAQLGSKVETVSEQVQGLTPNSFPRRPPP